MSNLINFFFSFDKLMKEKLVAAFFWLSAILLGIEFAERVSKTIWLSPIAKLLAFVQFFVTFALALVALRLLCELAIAVFRINDNLSPDGGKSETADIDPMIMEARKVAEDARKVAEDAAKKATAATKSVVNRGRSDDDVKPAKKDSTADKEPTIIDVPPKASAPKKGPVKTGSKAKHTAKKDTPKTAATKAPAKKKAPATKATPKKTAAKPATNKDGSPRKKPGPKPKD